MKKQFISLLPSLVLLTMDFYLLPFFVRDTAGAMWCMLGLMPLIAFMIGFLYSLKHGFTWLLAPAAAILFIPTIFLYYNSSAWVYAVAYGIIVFLGNGVGYLLYGKR